MPTEFTDMEQATAFDRLRLVIVGKEKTGKSRLACTGRPGVLLLDFDKRRESVAGMKGVMAVTFTDPGNETLQPTAFPDALDLLTQLESNQSFCSLNKDWKHLPPDFRVRTVVAD